MLGYYKMSVIGTSHQAKEDGVCQDASDVIVLDNGWVAAAIADGLGSAKKSDIGAAAAVKTVLSFVQENLPYKWHNESLISLLRTAYHKALAAIRIISDTDQIDICDYDTTLTTVIYNGVNVVYGHAGDGGIITLSSFGDYSVLTNAQKGEVFNETSPLRAGPDSWSFGVSRDDVCALTMMTDGIFDVACPWLLAKSKQPIYINFIRPFIDKNIIKVLNQDDFEKLQSEIIEFFCGDDCKQITDDKTIVGIINTDIIPELKSDDFYQEPDWKTIVEKHNNLLYTNENNSEPNEQTLIDQELMADNISPDTQEEYLSEEDGKSDISESTDFQEKQDVDKVVLSNEKKSFLERLFRKM